jgi:MFS family permease
MAGFSLLLLALSQGHDWGWTRWPTLGAGTIGALMLVTFVRLESARTEPLLDLRLFQNRAFTGAVLSAICNYVTLFVPAILLPFYLSEGLGLTPGQSGTLLSIQPLVMAVVASPSGALSDRIGTQGLATAGMLVLFAALLGMATLNGATPLLTVGLWLAAAGLGTGIFISPNSSALMGAAPRHQQGIAGGVLGVARTIGMIAGIALATSLFSGQGGQTGRAWGATDFHALHVALIVAAVVSALGALAAWWGRIRMALGESPPRIRINEDDENGRR